MNETNLTPESNNLDLRKWTFVLPTLVAIFTVCLILLLFYNSSNLKDIAFSYYNFSNSSVGLEKVDSKKLKKDLDQARKRVSNLEKRLVQLVPNEPFLIVNTTHNTFTLRTRTKVIRQNICSTGSYTLLDAGDNRKWIFKTPKGRFHIQGKVADPVWIKPDWAFIEEGLPVPKKGSPERYEYGTLGDYALSLGQGYLIHGTLYQRFLGLPVTHGCIRLGDEDLEAVYRNLNIGSKVFIY